MKRSMRVQMAPGGPEVSRLAVGMMRLLDQPDQADERGITARIQACIELGLTTFDHADIYGGYRCERAFGAALEANPRLRDHIEIVTKCGIMLVDPARPHHRIKHYDYSRRHIVASVERSLENLCTEYIDVLLLHRPSPLLDPDEVAEAVRQLREQGKVRHVGVSNFTPSQCDALASRLECPIVTNQIEIHPLRLEPFVDGTLDHCVASGIAPMAWSPTAGGRLFHDGDARVSRVRGALGRVAETLGAPIDRVIFAWLLSHPSRIIPIVGANCLDYIRSAAGAVALELDVQDWFAIWSASAGAEVP